MISFFRNLFISKEERGIRTILSHRDVNAAIIVIHRTPMTGLVTRLCFERTEAGARCSRLTSSMLAVEGTAAKQMPASIFDAAIDSLAESATKNPRYQSGVKDGESYLVLWGRRADTRSLFVRWPNTNKRASEAIAALLSCCAP